MSNPYDLQSFFLMVAAGDFVVLDTETTGLTDRAEICQIAIIDSKGTVLLNSLVHPQRSIPHEATNIHGITNDMVEDAPDWGKIRPLVLALTSEKNVVIYNASYDRRLMHQSDRALSLKMTDYKERSIHWCAMEAFAEIYGDWNEYKGSYRWKKLSEALMHYDLPVPNDQHSALADCQSTLAVVYAMATAQT